MNRITSTVLASLFLLVGAAVFLGACSEKAAAPGGVTGKESPESQEERLKKARGLLALSNDALPRDKIGILRRLIALYPETEPAQTGHFLLCFYLQDSVVARYDEAWKATLTYRDRHPKDPRVNEAFKWIASNADRKAEGFNGPDTATILKSWGDYLEDVLKTVTDDDGDLRSTLLRGRAEVYARGGDLPAAQRTLEAAAAAPCADPNQRFEILWYLAGFLESDPAKKDARRQYLEEALELKKSGARGQPEEVILAALESTR